MLRPRTALIVVVVLVACGDSAVPSSTTMTEPVATTTLPTGYLALGDSYTIGEGVLASERWPVQLVGLVRERGLQLADPVIVARTGWTTAELDAAIDRADPTGANLLVTLLIGVNNQYRGLSLDEYRIEFADLLDRAIAFADGEPDRVVVLSIPDWGVTPFASGANTARIADDIDAFNAVAAEETAAAGAHFVDITGISRSAPNMVTSDGLHPSGEMYRMWAEAALETVIAILEG